ncbi:hypothetical protein F5887DRAFT_1158128 [Amanita rubescens]|nr:hypothetical protein F5887DRAFT_1158128 [Amanita rubescens]
MSSTTSIPIIRGSCRNFRNMGQNSSSSSEPGPRNFDPDKPYDSDDTSDDLVSPIEPPITRIPFLAKVNTEPSLRSSSYQIYDWPLNKVACRILTFPEDVPTKRFRLIDCKAYLNGIIRVVEYSSNAIIPPYAAISYVWKGIHQAKHAESFAVAGALDGDPISQEVLRITCITAIEQGARLRIPTRIGRYRIWRGSMKNPTCVSCYVEGLGGWPSFKRGLHGCTGRGRCKKFYFRRTSNSYFIGNWGMVAGEMVAASKRLKTLPGILVVGIEDSVWPLDENGPSKFTADSMDADSDLIRSYMDENDHELLTKAALTRAKSIDRFDRGSRDSMEMAIWRCALLRTSKRDVDVVFSIMGLFGVSLDPGAYRKKSQEDVMIAFVKEIMRKGGRANWFAASLSSPVMDRLSTMPKMPERFEPKERGTIEFERQLKRRDFRDMLEESFIRTPHGVIQAASDDEDDEDEVTHCLQIPAYMAAVTQGWYLEGAPQGFVDNDGKTRAPLAGEIGTHAVVIGKAQYFPSDRRSDSPPSILMLLKPHTANDHDKWYKIGMAYVPTVFTEKWLSRQIGVGGTHNDRHPYRLMNL